MACFLPFHPYIRWALGSLISLSVWLQLSNQTSFRTLLRHLGVLLSKVAAFLLIHSVTRMYFQKTDSL